MPIVVKVGYSEFLMKTEAQATKLLSALVGAVAVESRTFAGKELFWPAESAFMGECSVKTIRQDQLRTAKPGEVFLKSSCLELPEKSGGAQ